MRRSFLVCAFALALVAAPPAVAVGRPTGWAGMDRASRPSLATGGNSGEAHACQLNADATVRCWGSNGSGQLGDGTFSNRTLPVAALGVTKAVAVSAGDFHTCVVLSDGTARCWGLNGFGRLGDGTTATHATPTSVSGLTNAVGIAAGARHTCALLADGTARCWGANASGQLGDGTTTDRSLPVAVRGLTRAVAIDAGGDHTCALLVDGTIRCWGSNTHGELGDNSALLSETTPVSVDGVTTAKAISVGSGHACAVLADGTGRCWGYNGEGEIGDGTFTNRRRPVAVSNLAGAVAVSAGSGHTCALLADGTGRCWGWNYAGQLGDATTASHVTPRAVSGLVVAVAISAGSGDSCALVADGSARCWGSNATGQLGNGTFSGGLTPTVVAGGGGGFMAREVASGVTHTCALRANSGVACWGDNRYGQLGNGTTTDQRTPVNNGLTNVVALDAGGASSCALIADGSARCWGLNGYGELGDGTRGQRATPVRVSGLTDAIAITDGGSHACALIADGTVRCWGKFEQLGFGGCCLFGPVFPVTGLSNAVAIAADFGHTCALIVDGTVRCWGTNESGQLGDASLWDSLTPPVAVVDLTDVVAITAGGQHSCAVLVDGTARCWGYGRTGALGNGYSAYDFWVPVGVTGLTGAAAINTGGYHTCSVGAFGSMNCWGWNVWGQVGDGTILLRLTPVPVQIKVTSINLSFFLPLTGVTGASGGADHTCAVTVVGAVWCWGSNGYGQLGDGSTTTYRSTAAAVPSFTLNIDPQVVLSDNGRVTTVTVVATCEPGRRLHVAVELTQEAASGAGAADFDCTGGLDRYPVTAPAHGAKPFAAGPARVTAAATIRGGSSVVEEQEWTRDVSVQSAP